jgi:anti-sigma regulatory factor (Ser/Thr protein kinase)
MRPDQATPPKVARPATPEALSARLELARLRTACGRQRRVFRALGDAASALCLRAAALHAESAELRVRAAALGAEDAGPRAARELRVAPAPAVGRVAARNAHTLSLDRRAPADARIMVTEFLNDQVPACVLDNARSVVSELVSNSVRHGGVSGVVVVDVQLTAAMVRLEVADPGRAGVIGPPSPDHANGPGFGLQLVAALSERWGLERVATGGTRVWAQLLRTPPGSNGRTPLALVRATPSAQGRSQDAGRRPAREQHAGARHVALVRERSEQEDEREQSMA